MKRIVNVPLMLLVAVLMPGCASLVPSDDAARYQAAIRDAAVIETQEIVPLPTVPAGKVRVVTWTKFPDSYPIGKPTQLKWREVWVTLDKVVQGHCRQFPAASRVSDTQKLLGLPADNTEQRSFITLEVDAAAMFRPCANASLQDETCSSTFPKGVGQDHAAWYAKQASQSYQAQKGFPWTRLGYTYNWKAGANEVGVAEFVVKTGAQVLPIAAAKTEDYCRENP